MSNDKRREELAAMEAFANLFQSWAQGDDPRNKEIKVGGRTLEQIKRKIIDSARGHVGTRRVLRVLREDKTGAMWRVLTKGVGDGSVHMYRKMIREVAEDKGVRVTMEQDEMAKRLGMGVVQDAKDFNRKLVGKVREARTKEELLAMAVQVGSKGELAKGVLKFIQKEVGKIDEMERRGRATRDYFEAKVKREVSKGDQERGADAEQLKKATSEQLRKAIGLEEEKGKGMVKRIRELEVAKRRLGGKTNPIARRAAENVDRQLKLAREGLRGVGDRLKQLEQMVKEQEVVEKQMKKEPLTLGEIANKKREEAKEKNKRGQERMAKGEVVGGKTDELWEHKMESARGEYRNKTIAEIWDSPRGQERVANWLEGEMGGRLSAKDMAKLVELKRKSQVVKEFVEYYWKVREGADTSANQERKGGWRLADRARVNSGEDLDRGDTHDPAGTGLRRRVARNRHTGEEEEITMSPTRKRGEWDPKLTEDKFRDEVRRDVFRGIWRKAMAEAQDLGRWKKVRDGVWKRWSLENMNWEYYREGKKKREPFREHARDLYQRGERVAAMQYRTLTAISMLKGRMERAGVTGEPEWEKVREVADRMGDVVEVEMKRRKLAYMQERGWLDAPKAITGWDREANAVNQEEAGWDVKEKERQRQMRMTPEEREYLRGMSMEGSEDGAQRGKQFRDRWDQEELLERPRNEWPWWLRVENAEGLEELEKIREEMEQEYGEVGVELVIMQGSGLGRVMEERRKVLEWKEQQMAAANSGP